ncbi:mycothiol conjugate amidase Mca [Conyzicola nivalis]|uniref:Mycothiol S-conjugate amidase n=1 Tax=Conyzicola nivalis TaxID=1477021 RepID=A0A916STL2_9MICO|nr:mycothiol conjugate amidase Mca [Conyzicola nivalis]GGB15218.1 mycothiol S-conjugate amidase [Conyzicola nivalis]
MTLRLLAVHAHPDDESSKGAATYAYYRDRGVDVTVVSCTGGERGDIQNPALEATAMADRDMSGLRRIEMARAQAFMGIDHRWLGYLDSGLPENGEALQPQSFAMTPLEISGVPLVKVIRELRPHVVITYDENGGYPHPDHIRAHEVTMWALAAAADAAQLPEWGAAWTVSKLYYDRIISPQRFRAVYDAMVSKAPDHPLLASLEEMKGWMTQRGESNLTTQIAVGDFFDVRDSALRAHASQVASDSPYFFWPNEIQQAVWPWEDFELVRSSVDTTLPETDLFAGITDEDEQ